MGEKSKIEWCDNTFNPWIGCQKVSSGCDHCYAEAMMDHRYGKVEWGPHAPRKRTSVNYWKQPFKWNREVGAFKREYGHRPRVFCASLADVFDNQEPASWRKDLFDLIRKCDQLDWLMLTKRPQNAGLLRCMSPLLAQSGHSRHCNNLSAIGVTTDMPNGYSEYKNLKI
jgi:protein gp37